MSRDVTYSIDESEYLAKHQENLKGERTLSDWILMLFYADSEAQIHGTTRLMCEVFLMYHEIIQKRGVDLYVLFIKSEYGVYSKEVEYSIRDLLFTNQLITKYGKDNDDIYIKIDEQGIEAVKHFCDDRLNDTLRDKRREWDELNMNDLIKYVNATYPYYSFFKSTKADVLYNEGNDRLFDTLEPNIEQINEAIMYYNKALAINPDYDLAWKRKGEALQKLGKDKEAINCLDKAIEINPKLVTAWNDRSMSIYHLGMPDEAIKSLDIAMEIDPENETAQNNKRRILESK